MKNYFENYFYTLSYLEDLEWLRNDLKFYANLKKLEVKDLYKTHIEWEISQLKLLKDKLKQYG